MLLQQMHLLNLNGEISEVGGGVWLEVPKIKE